MATKKVYITGESIFSYNITHADDYKGTSNYKVTLKVDGDNLQEFIKSGIKTKVREYNGDTVVTLKLKEEDGPINIVDKEGEELEALIADGSILTVKAEVFDTKYGVGHRIDTVRVDELVPYVSEKREDAEEPSTSEDGSKGPEKTKSKASPKIPF